MVLPSTGIQHVSFVSVRGTVDVMSETQNNVLSWSFNGTWQVVVDYHFLLPPTALARLTCCKSAAVV